MNPTTIDQAAVSAALAGAYGQRVWGTALGVGSFVTLELGAPRPAAEPNGRPHGEFHLWLYCCAWRIETAEEMIASSEDPRDELESAVTVLDGHTLRSADVGWPSLSTSFHFDAGLTLRTFTVFSTDHEHWYLYLPDGMVLTAGPGSGVSLSR